MMDFYEAAYQQQFPHKTICLNFKMNEFNDDNVMLQQVRQRQLMFAYVWDRDHIWPYGLCCFPITKRYIALREEKKKHDSLLYIVLKSVSERESVYNWHLQFTLFVCPTSKCVSNCQTRKFGVFFWFSSENSLILNDFSLFVIVTTNIVWI